jgi:hypothetical protein
MYYTITLLFSNLVLRPSTGGDDGSGGGTSGTH